jgi:hypothetical protein
MGAQLVDAASSFLVERISRRGFLARAAIVGSALATDPLGYVLRPGTAYASVCGPDSSCGAGYSVFCCTVSNGANSCPPDTIASGWWKANGAALCGGKARYYVDCNATCSHCSSGCGHFCNSSCWSCSCRCGSTSSCDQRRVCCNVFRYGQCHQEVSCVGPVACRMVTCIPPYRLGLSCSTASATDNATVAHSAPCQLNSWDAIAAHYYAVGGSTSPLGATVGGEYGVHGGVGANFTGGRMYASSATGAHYVRGAILTKYLALHGTAGFLGFPTSDELAAAGGGRYSSFTGGIVVWSTSTGARYVRGAILTKYLALHGTAGRLGYPVTDEYAVAAGMESEFRGGWITRSAATGRVTVRYK